MLEKEGDTPYRPPPLPPSGIQKSRRAQIGQKFIEPARHISGVRGVRHCGRRCDRRRGASRTGGSGGTRGACRAAGAIRADQAFRSRWAGGPSRSCCARGACFTRRTGGTRRACGAGGARCTCRARGARCARRAGGTRRAGGACRAGLACQSGESPRAGRACGSRRPDEAGDGRERAAGAAAPAVSAALLRLAAIVSFHRIDHSFPGGGQRPRPKPVYGRSVPSVPAKTEPGVRLPFGSRAPFPCIPYAGTQDLSIVLR